MQHSSRQKDVLHIFMAKCIDRCMQAPSKSQKHGAAVNRRRRLQSAAPERSDGAERFEFDFKIVKDVLPGSVPAICREILQRGFSPVGPNFAPRRPKTASRSDDTASRSEDDAQLRPKTLQDRFKTALDPLLPPTWPNLVPSWSPSRCPNPVKTHGFCMFLLLHRFRS